MSNNYMKNRSTAILLALFLGGFGAHKFYLNKPGMGLLYIAFCWTFIPAIVAFFEAIAMLATNNDTFNSRKY